VLYIPTLDRGTRGSWKVVLLLLPTHGTLRGGAGPANTNDAMLKLSVCCGPAIVLEMPGMLLLVVVAAAADNDDDDWLVSTEAGRRRLRPFTVLFRAFTIFGAFFIGMNSQSKLLQIFL
jgi:hypothetical protein